MLEGQFFNPAIQGTEPALIQVFGTLLFCSIFLFLWRQSGVVYFRFWSLAWAVESLALLSGFGANWSGSTIFLWFRAVLEFLFALSLLTAARSAATATARGFGSSRRAMLFIPGLLLIVYGFLWRLPLAQFRGLHAAMLALIYAYSFVRIGVESNLNTGLGGKMMRFTLACLTLLYLGHAFLYLNYPLGEGIGALGMRWLSVYDLVPQTLLAFSAMAMWIQTQDNAVAKLRMELGAAARHATGSAELDHLTGLQNRTALERHLDEPFTGVVAVCDLDYFKDVNDRFGHLIGDEVLRSVGHLMRASIRPEDVAFRWGGDEFVIVFRHQHLDLVQDRMASMELRLMTFRIRGHGLFPLGLSWGVAEGDNRVLRPVLQEADLQMFERKRKTHARKG